MGEVFGRDNINNGDLRSLFHRSEIITFDENQKGIIVWCLGWKYDKSVYRANRDPLTGLFNRRYILDNIQKILSKTISKNNTLAIILLDIDGFKQVNDNFGHKAGDVVLRKVSDLLVNSFTSEDFVSRWGGDEFLIVSPISNHNSLSQKIAYFEKSIKNNCWEYNDLSVSIGQAIFPAAAEDFEGLISKADANMYELKSYKNY